MPASRDAGVPAAWFATSAGRSMPYATAEMLPVPENDSRPREKSKRAIATAAPRVACSAACATPISEPGERPARRRTASIAVDDATCASGP
jgi:hypothetical protein